MVKQIYQGINGLMKKITGALLFTALANLPQGCSVDSGSKHNYTPIYPGRIFFSSSRDGNNEIYSINHDGSGLERITYDVINHDLEPAVSPNGKRITVVKYDGAFNYAIFVMDSDGSNEQQLIGPIDYPTNPSWSPDGKKSFLITKNCM